jgi:hypothetical protein
MESLPGHRPGLLRALRGGSRTFLALINAKRSAALLPIVNRIEHCQSHRAWPIPVRGWRRSADQEGLAMTEE